MPIFEGQKFDFSIATPGPTPAVKVRQIPALRIKSREPIPFKGKNFAKYREKFDKDFERRHRNGKHRMFNAKEEETRDPSVELPQDIDFESPEQNEQAVV